VRPALALNATINVSGTPWGQSTCYLGVNEGSSGFNLADMQDLGITTYRLYGGLSRWEAQDDDGVYGSPSIAQIKANVNLINWTWWDNIMTTPPGGSDYHWASNYLVQMNARSIFSSLQTAGIRPILVLRNRDDQSRPAWSPNPPTTAADWNEWWEHVFATVYWLNVRNNYQVDDFEVHNEPNFSAQGWGGTEQQYWDFVRQTKDAITYVYATYLPGRTYHVYAPVTGQGNPYSSSWPERALQNLPGQFDSMDVHNYDADITSYTQQVHGWMNANGASTMPLWITEWGAYPRRNLAIPYDSNVAFGVNNILNNLIRGSRPGVDYVYGSHLFSLYDWGAGYLSGLIRPDSTRRNGYYPFRLGLRALQGCRTTYLSTASSTDLLALTTRDTGGNVYLLVTNKSTSAYSVDANLSALMTNATGTQWEYSSANQDVIIGNPTLSAGHVMFTLPATAGVLIKFGGL